MRKHHLVGAMVAVATMTCVGVASADDFSGGFSLSVGAPQGADVGFVFQPWTHLVRGEVGLAHNGLSFGGTAAATFTPIHFPIMPVLHLSAGFFPEGTPPAFVSSGKTMPSVGYDWVSFGPGLELGNRDGAVFFIHPALTYMHVSAGNVQATINSNSSTNLVVSDPTADGWVLPTVRVGFSLLF